MVTALQRIGDDIAERLLVVEIRLRSRSMATRMGALEDFGAMIACIERFRLEVETENPPREDLLRLLSRLGRKVSSVKRSPAYRVAAWFDAAELRWYVNQSSPLTAMC